MLTSLPNLADRNFILGFFLPALLFMLAVAFLFSDVEPVKTMFDALTQQNIGQGAYLLVTVWFGAVLLLMLNHPLYRFLEGYYFSGGFAEWMKTRQRARLARDEAELGTLQRRETAEGDAFPAQDSARIDKLLQTRLTRAPLRPQEMLPTAFGNAIKAFEVYPRDIYGADSITGWIRLSAVLSKDFAEQIQTTRTQIDFLINACCLAFLFAAISAARGIHHAAVVGCAVPDWAWPLAALVTLWLFYWAAIARVPAWGEMVMAAFDCYLPALAKQLGYDLPRETEDRRRFWTVLSQTFIYRTDGNGDVPFKSEDWIKPPAPAPEPVVQPVIVQVEVNEKRS